MTDAALSIRDKRAILLVTCSGAFLFPFMGSAVVVALPVIGVDLNMSAVELAWVPTAFLLTSALLLVPFGRFADMRGRRRVFITGVALYVVGGIVAWTANTGLVLVLSRVIQGSGGAMIGSTSLAILSSAYGAGERGKALGINAASIYSGLSLGPVIGGLVTQSMGWRGVFLVQIPLGLVLLAAAYLKLPAQRPTSRLVAFDWKGVGAYAVFLLGIMYGFTELPDTIGYAFLLAGALGFVALIRIEKTSPNPLVDIELFRSNLSFALSNVAAFLNYAAIHAASFLLSLYLQIVTGLSPRYAGLTLLAMPVVQALLSPIAGRLSDRVEPRVLASAGMAVTVVGLATLTGLRVDSSLTNVVGGLALLGFGVALFSSPNTNAVMSSVPPDKYGLGAATLTTTRQIGMVMSMGVAMLVLGSMVGEVNVSSTPIPAFVSAVKIVFGISAAFCSLGIVASLKRGRVHGTQTSAS